MRKCTVCGHAQRAEIDAALVGAESLRYVAETFGVSLWAARRHKANHLPATLARAQEAAHVARADDLMALLRQCLRRLNLLSDACDRSLRDPDNPERYDIGPRAEDVHVTYWEPGPNGKAVKRKARLSALLEQVKARREGAFAVDMIEIRHADPRELLPKIAARLRGQVELLAKLLGELDERPQVNVLVLPEWAAIRAAMLEALQPYPDARQAVAAALLRLEAGNDVGA